MAALPVSTKISSESTFTKKYRKRELRLGDGYSQRVTDGLNSTYWEGTVVYDGLTSSELSTVITYIDGIGSVSTFDYQPIGASSSVKFCLTDGGMSISTNGTISKVSFSCRQEVA